VLPKFIYLIFLAALINSCGNSLPDVKLKGAGVDTDSKRLTNAPATEKGGASAVQEKTQKDSLLILPLTGKPLIVSGFLSKPRDVAT